MTYNGNTIRSYDLSSGKFIETARYANREKMSRYTCLTSAGGYLYAAADTTLEVFTVGGGGEGEEPAEVKPVSSELYIKPSADHSVYYMHCHNGRLFMGSGDLLVINILNPQSPEHLAKYKNFETSSPYGFHFFDDYLLADHLYNLSDLDHPVQLGAVCSDHAPLQIFGKPSLPKSLFSCGDDHGLLRYIDVDDAGHDGFKQYVYCPVLTEDRKYEQRSVYNLANCLAEDILISVSKYDVYLYRKGPADVYESLDCRPALIGAVDEMFAGFTKGDSIGAVAVEINQWYARLLFFSHISPVAMDKSTPLSEVYLYWSNVFGEDRFSEKNPLIFDLPALADYIAQCPKLSESAVKVVLVKVERLDAKQSVVEKYIRKVVGPEKPWSPLRLSANKLSVPDTTGSILASGNENLLRDLRDRAVDDSEIMQEVLLSLTDKERKISAIRVACSLPDRQFVKWVFITGAVLGPPIQIQSVEQAQAAGSFDAAFDDLPADIGKGVKGDFVLQLAHGLYDEFKDDPDMNRVLMLCLPNLENDAAAYIAWKLKLDTHPELIAYITGLIDNEVLYYDEYRGRNYNDWTDGLDLTRLPAATLEPLAPRLRKEFQRLTELPDGSQIEQLIPIYEMLFRLGDTPPLPEKILTAAKEARGLYEQYDMSFSGHDSDGYEDEDHPVVHSLILERRVRAREIAARLRRIAEGEEIAVYADQWQAEPFKRSWIRLWQVLTSQENPLDGGIKALELVDALAATIQRSGESYDHDRQMALHFMDFVMTRIVEHPDIASPASKMYTALEKARENFDAKVNISGLRTKGLLAVLQQAWGDVKSGDYAAARAKGEAVLKFDPAFGQVHFLLGRLHWLERGVESYLEQADDYLAKATPDKTGLARLYNLTGCAYDELKDPAKAIPYFEKAAVNEPENGMYIANIAECYYKLGHPEDAVKYAGHAQAKGHKSDMLSEIFANQGVLPK